MLAQLHANQIHGSDVSVVGVAFFCASTAFGEITVRIRSDSFSDIIMDDVNRALYLGLVTEQLTFVEQWLGHPLELKPSFRSGDHPQMFSLTNRDNGSELAIHIPLQALPELPIFFEADLHGSPIQIEWQVSAWQLELQAITLNAANTINPAELPIVLLPASFSAHWAAWMIHTPTGFRLHGRMDRSPLHWSVQRIGSTAAGETDRSASQGRLYVTIDMTLQPFIGYVPDQPFELFSAIEEVDAQLDLNDGSSLRGSLSALGRGYAFHARELI